MQQLLALISDCQTHSFEKLTALLKCDDAQLLQEIQQLQQQGIQIDTSFGEVKLIPQTELLDLCRIQTELPYQIIYQPVIHSTNQFLIENIKRLNKGDICIAEHQTAGRGRRGRQWLSPFASQLMFSFIWQVDARKAIDGLSLVIGMAIYEAIQELGGKNVMLKWPNDILLNGRKLAGILIEITHNCKGKLHLVIGIGLNIALPQQNQINQPWANLTEILPKIDRTLLFIKLIKHIYAKLAQFEQQGISSEFCQQWQERDAFFGEEVHIITEKETISGIEQGIDQRGYLQLLVNGNQQMHFNGGEVSLRKK
ncbi:bifunctional biotin--[acetyl-CoA-carboxylase] ligase/biotin operon repressor BirA [Pasteurellaceae bacterium 22721_9_1]